MTFEDVIRLKLPDGTPAELRLRSERMHKYQEPARTSRAKPQTKVHYEEPETWLEYALRDGFMAALRILPDEGGQLVVAEVRVFAREGSDDGGRWERRFGSTNQPTAIGVPTGGVPARVLREVRIPSSLRAIRGLMREFREGWTKLGVDPFGHGVLFGSQGFTEEAAEDPPRQGPGRPRLDDRELAVLARDYVRLLDHGEAAPIQELAEKWHLAPSSISDRLGKARERGLLTPPPKGRAGGELTPRTEALLKQRRR